MKPSTEATISRQRRTLQARMFSLATMSRSPVSRRSRSLMTRWVSASSPSRCGTSSSGPRMVRKINQPTWCHQPSRASSMGSLQRTPATCRFDPTWLIRRRQQVRISRRGSSLRCRWTQSLNCPWILSWQDAATTRQTRASRRSLPTGRCTTWSSRSCSWSSFPR